MSKNIGNVDIVREFGLRLNEEHLRKARAYRAKLVIVQWDRGRNVVRVDARGCIGVLWGNDKRKLSVDDWLPHPAFHGCRKCSGVGLREL